MNLFITNGLGPASGATIRVVEYIKNKINNRKFKVKITT